MPDFLFPHRYQLKYEFAHLYAEWHAAKQATIPEFKIENVRFEHDPDWNTRLFSIQSARDGNHVVWRAARIAWMTVGGPI